MPRLRSRGALPTSPAAKKNRSVGPALGAEDGRLALEFPHYSPTVQTPSPLPSVLASLQEAGPPSLGPEHSWCEDTLDLLLYAERMAAFEAIERLQKFDWLIQKLHSLRTSLQSEPGLTELQQLHALQLLQRNAGFNGSSLGDAEEEEKMELCKLEGEEEEEMVDTEEEEDEDISEDQSLPLALTTTISETNTSLERASNSPGRAHSPIINSANDTDNDNLESLDKLDNELEEQSEEREEDRVVEREEREGSPPGVPPATYPRFPTSHLFPPLPFDNLLPLIGDDADLKVGGFRTK